MSLNRPAVTSSFQAPISAEVQAPQPECTIVRAGKTAYCYHHGSFFLWVPDKKGDLNRSMQHFMWPNSQKEIVQ